jgi:hypothetical protein
VAVVQRARAASQVAPLLNRHRVRARLDRQRRAQLRQVQLRQIQQPQVRQHLVRRHPTRRTRTERIPTGRLRTQQHRTARVRTEPLPIRLRRTRVRVQTRIRHPCLRTPVQRRIRTVRLPLLILQDWHPERVVARTGCSTVFWRALRVRFFVCPRISSGVFSAVSSGRKHPASFPGGSTSPESPRR